MFRVLVSSSAGEPMLYRDFHEVWEASRWAQWARDFLLCRVQTFQMGDPATPAAVHPICRKMAEAAAWA
jgi:hypothetical protein